MYLWLLRGELFQSRTTWFSYVVMMSFAPLVTLTSLWFFSGSSPSVALFIITGSITTAASTSAMLTRGQDIGQMKDAGRFEYYASLPISKAMFILALTTRSMILVVVFRLPMNISPVTIIVFLLAGYSLAGLGAFIGFFSRDGQMAGADYLPCASIHICREPAAVSAIHVEASSHHVRGTCPSGVHFWSSDTSNMVGYRCSSFVGNRFIVYCLCEVELACGRVTC